MSVSEFAEAYEDDERALRGAILTEPISAIPPRAPLIVAPETLVGEAVSQMNHRHRGFVCVVEGGRLSGIFTERDLLRLVEQHADPREMPVGKVMTRSPETLSPDDRIALALNRMSEGGFRHIPVVDSDGAPVGIIAMRDIVRFIVSLFPDAVLNLPPTDAIQTEYGG